MRRTNTRISPPKKKVVQKITSKSTLLLPYAAVPHAALSGSPELPGGAPPGGFSPGDIGPLPTLLARKLLSTYRTAKRIPHWTIIVARLNVSKGFHQLSGAN